MLNLTIEGQITKEPELRKTPNGVWVTRFTVVHNARRMDKVSGKWVNHGKGLFVDIDCWRGLAERAAFLRKKDLVVIECEDDLRMDTYNNYTGLRVTARNLAISMRFDQAESHREDRAPSGDTVRTADGDEYEAEAYAALADERSRAANERLSNDREFAEVS